MSLLISDEKVLKIIRELSEKKDLSPEEIVAAAVMEYAKNELEYRDNDAFWSSIIGLGNSDAPTLAAQDEEELADIYDQKDKEFWNSIRGIGDSGDTDLARNIKDILHEATDPIEGWKKLPHAPETPEL